MRTIVIAPDSFKGTITAARAADAIAAGWRSVDSASRLILRPMADGGEGTIAAFAESIDGARSMPVTVVGPTGGPVDSGWLLLPAQDDAPRGTGVVELANTSGIELLGCRANLRPLESEGDAGARVAWPGRRRSRPMIRHRIL